MIGICILIWIISIFLFVVVMIRKNIKPNFWSWLFTLLPIVNTWIVIKYFRINIGIDGFKKKFWQELEGKELWQ